MLAKIIALFCALALPFTVVLWHQSHRHPAHHRYDLTLYKSASVYLKNGACGVSILSMPRKVSARSEFHVKMQWDPLPLQSPLLFSSTTRGSTQLTWIVFRFWMVVVLLLGAAGLSLASGPVRDWRRLRGGMCVSCGYDLRGALTRRCPECGVFPKRKVRR